MTETERKEYELWHYPLEEYITIPRRTLPIVTTFTTSDGVLVLDYLRHNID